MTSQAQIDANRRNAQASTGPRTPEGKARSRRNAVTHGLCAETTPESGEDAATFAALYRSLMATYQPLTLEEQNQVARIASLSWRLSRLPAAENALHERVESRLAADGEPAGGPPAVWAAALCDPEAQRAHTALQRYEAHLARQLAVAHQTFQTLRKIRRATHPPLVYLSEDPEWAADSEYAYVNDVHDGEGWSPDGLLPAHGLAEHHVAANDPGPAAPAADLRTDDAPQEAVSLDPAPDAAPDEGAAPEPAPLTAPTPASYPDGHESYGDPLRMRPKMTKEEVAAWRPPGDAPQAGNYHYPDGRLRYWPGDAGSGDDGV